MNPAAPRPELLPTPAPVPPPDARTLDRLRRLTRRAWNLARTPPLLVYGIVRRRTVTLPSETLVQRLLVLRTDRLGDMALTSGALLDLKAHFRHARITVVAREAALELLAAHPAVDRRAPLSGGRLPDGIAGAFDLVIDFTPDERLLGARLAAATRAPWRIGFGAAGREAFFTLRGPRVKDDRHIVDLNRDLLEALGAPRRDTAPALFITREERSAAQARFAALGAASPRVVVHPGAHYPSQRWSAERFGDVITRLTERLGAACVVIAGPGEETIARQVAERTPDALIASPVTVRAMMGLVGTSDLFLGNNSGPLHVAAALGVPTLSVMGPTDPRRFLPRGPSDTVLRRPISCSPCTRGQCWHQTCLVSIDAEEVAAAAQRILTSAPRRREAA